MKYRRPYRFLGGTLRGRLILSVAMVHAVMMSLFVVDLTRRQRTMLLDRQVEEATALSQALSTTAAGWLAASDLAGLQELVDAQRRYPELAYAILADAQGRILAHTDRTQNGRYLLDLPRGMRQVRYGNAPESADVASPAMLGGRLVGWARVGIAHQTADRTLSRITYFGMGYGLGAILIGSLIAWYMGGRITRRLYAVQSTIAAVKAGDPAARARMAGDDEAAQMAREFDDMLDALAKRESERLQAEAALHASEAVHKAFFENSMDAVLLGLPDGTVFSANPAACALLGATEAELCALGRKGLVDPADAHLPGYLTVREETGKAQSEIAMIKADGTRFDADVRTSMYADASGKTMVCVIIRDLTERRKIEHERKALNEGLERLVRERTERLEAANRELEAFAYSVSHDLRAPLRAMDGFSAALMEDHADTLDATAQDYLRRIRAGSTQMAALIDDLLNLSRVSRTAMLRGRVDLTALAERIATDLRRAHPGRAVELVVASGLMVDADAGLMRVVMDNLLGNAWKFTGRHATARIEVGAREVAGEQVYFVRDNGAGFDMAYAGKLFGAFQRLHGAAEFEGTGIGLALVQRIIQRHGGRVWAEGTVEHGATFHFTLPAPDGAST